MRRLLLLLLLPVIGLMAEPAPVLAQDPPPRIPHVVVDVRGSMPKFSQEQQLADSRGLFLADMPPDIVLHNAWPMLPIAALTLLVAGLAVRRAVT